MCDAPGVAELETIVDASAALDQCGDLFRSDPVACNMVTAALGPSSQARLLRAHDGATTTGVALIIGETCLVTPLGPGVAELIAPAIEVAAPIVISGPAGDAAALAGLLSERVDAAIVDAQLIRLYRATEIIEPSQRRRGKSFESDRDRLAQAADWAVSFGADTGLVRSREEAQAQMAQALNEHRVLEWRSKGEVVSQLLITPARFGVVRIGGVYTAPEHRKRGHGAAFVAAVAQQQLDRQKVDMVVLNAQASNAATNRMYRRLGFGAALETLTVTVDAR